MLHPAITKQEAQQKPVAPNAETEVHDSPKKAAVTGPVSSDTRTNAAGVTQTGRNLGAIRMDLGAAEAYVGGKISPFSSQPLPETKGYLSNFPADSGSARYSGEVNNVDLAGYGNLTKTEVPFHKSPDLGGIGETIATSGANFFAGTSGSSAAKAESGGKSKIDYSDFGGSDPMSYATSNEEARRRSRFLDASDSLQGVKNIQADQGIVYAGGQHYANTGEGEKAFSKIGSDTVRGIMNSAPEKANELKNAYIAGLKKTDSTESGENTLASRIRTLLSPLHLGIPPLMALLSALSLNIKSISTSITPIRPKISSILPISTFSKVIPRNFPPISTDFRNLNSIQ